ncbi:MAG: 30S ribosomal protein S8 [Candidatus Nealsonbacteria bacterium RBG_13_38_11]|uniref:Small ribosomal subunit protein uS8 n=1 Tax=Candidatus Nealsonbacteria bacterium RBG_13_38_11 TaxID=1801662 RepID=A0A1G2DY12_9BACT|nr:MAG: 30S ribosomal protein S8 [Candidatus Nealsonbacteria bacterium RBG_13_38_11]HXK32280.1 30S ribosomal protein S8 [Candidatus Paceibacterota bacterium]
MTDPVADMLNTIKNAQAVNHPTVEVVFSNLKYEIAKLLEKQGFISGIEKKGKKNRKTMEITLKYEDKIPAISGLKKVSKPGQRIYVNSTRIKRVKDGHGMAVISTSKGLMTDKEARKQKRGGEILCEIW